MLNVKNHIPVRADPVSQQPLAKPSDPVTQPSVAEQRAALAGAQEAFKTNVVFVHDAEAVKTVFAGSPEQGEKYLEYVSALPPLLPPDATKEQIADYKAATAKAYEQITSAPDSHTKRRICYALLALLCALTIVGSFVAAAKLGLVEMSHTSQIAAAAGLTVLDGVCVAAGIFAASEALGVPAAAVSAEHAENERTLYRNLDNLTRDPNAMPEPFPVPPPEHVVAEIETAQAQRHAGSQHGAGPAGGEGNSWDPLLAQPR